jgi:hypothetical protein
MDIALRAAGIYRFVEVQRRSIWYIWDPEVIQPTAYLTFISGKTS